MAARQRSLWIIAWIWVLLCIGCNARQGSAFTAEQAGEVSVGPKVSRTTLDKDSLLVLRHLATLKCRPRQIVRGDLSRFAVVVEPSPSCRHQVLVLQVKADSVVSLRTNQDTECCLPASIRWVGLLGLRGRALEMRFDNPVESAVGTEIYGDTGKLGGFYRIYQDDRNACGPAELRDLDNDGNAELVRYQEDPSHGDCDNACHIAIRNRFGMPPDWLQIEHWDGSTWTPAPGQHRSFYAALARKYEAMDRWLAEGSATPCNTIYWMDDRSIFRRWAGRSDSLAKQ